MLIFRGNRPANVVKAAKYSVVHVTAGKFAIRLIYQHDRYERELMTTSEHPQLVALVNEVKLAKNGAPCGAFYLNEHRQVVVPAGSEYYLAGSYDQLLEFRDGSKVVSAKPPAELTPGQAWSGPRPGIPYVVAAGGDDLYYEAETAPRRIRRHSLAEIAGKPAARQLAQRLAAHKGHGGGRVYLNEAQAFFAPVNNGEQDYEYRYLGSLDGALWFPAGAGVVG